MLRLFVPSELQSFGFYSKHLDKSHTTHFITYTFSSQNLEDTGSFHKPEVVMSPLHFQGEFTKM